MFNKGSTKEAAPPLLFRTETRGVAASCIYGASFAFL